MAKITAATTRSPPKLHTRRMYSSGGTFVPDFNVGLAGGTAELWLYPLPLAWPFPLPFA